MKRRKRMAGNKEKEEMKRNSAREGGKWRETKFRFKEEGKKMKRRKREERGEMEEQNEEKNK